jgi:hypothetical protein
MIVDVSGESNLNSNEHPPLPLEHTNQRMYCPKCSENHSYQDCSMRSNYRDEGNREERQRIPFHLEKDPKKRKRMTRFYKSDF